MKHGAIVLLNLAVAELALEHLLGKKTILYLSLLKSQLYLTLGTRGLYDIKPLLAGFLIGRSNNLYLVATL